VPSGRPRGGGGRRRGGRTGPGRRRPPGTMCLEEGGGGLGGGREELGGLLGGIVWGSFVTVSGRIFGRVSGSVFIVYCKGLSSFCKGVFKRFC
jgi:hypothetical protein